VWTTGCISKLDGDGKAESYSKTTRTMTKSESSETSEDFDAADTTCAKAAMFTISATATFTVGEEVSTPAGARAVDFSPTKIVVTLKNADTVSNFIEGKMCGKADWVINTEVDVTTSECEGDGQKMNATIYDIYDVDGSTLKFGDRNESKNGTTSALRPTSLSTKDDVFTKQ
jgi:hypothetical protein